MHRVKRSILVAAASTAILVAMAGCGADGDSGTADSGAKSARPAIPEVTPAPGDHDMLMTWAETDRNWALHAPPGYRPGTPVPLVVAMHGHSQSVQGLRTSSGLDAVADRNGFLVAYPQSLGPGFAGLGSSNENDDIGFVRAVVDQLVKKWSVDPARVYVTGFSVGGEMAFKLGVEAADLFAAIAPVSGGFVGAKPASDPGYKPARPVSMITFIGRDDRNASRIYSGLAKWHSNLGCKPGEPAWVDTTKKVNVTTSKCADGSEVVDYTVNDMGHAWPSATGFKTSVDATVAMWEFFAAHPRGA